MSFKIASKFREAAVQINCIPVEKFPLLLNRVIQRLHLRNTRLFNSEEEEQLKSLFSLSSDQLKLVLDGCCYIFEQAAYTSTAPEPLYELLLESGFDESHGKVMGKLWASEAAGFIGKLKDRSMQTSVLQSTDYRLNILMGTSSLTRLAEPTAIFEFAIASDPKSNTSTHKESDTLANVEIAASTGLERLNVEYSHEELYDLLVQLDRVQGQLDTLSST